MNDLETRLGDALRAVADDQRRGTPDVVGLADAARIRHRTRRRRRVAGGAVATVAAGALALGIALGVPLPGGPSRSDDLAAPSPTTATEGWRTVEIEGFKAEVPDDWALDDDPCRPIGPEVVEGGQVPCGLDLYASLAVFDPDDLTSSVGPGVVQNADNGYSGGYVRVEGQEIAVSSPDPAVVRQVLASVRPAGEPAPDLGDRWDVVTLGAGVAIEEPSSWPLEPLEAGDSGPGVLVTDGLMRTFRPTENADGSWTAAEGSPVGTVVVWAPTSALAQVVRGTLEVLR